MSLTDRVARLLLPYMDYYVHGDWVGSKNFLVRRALIDQASEAWLRLGKERTAVTLADVSIGVLAAQLGDRPLVRTQEYEYAGAIRCRVYRAPGGESRALVSVSIDSIVTALRIRTLYTASSATLVDSPLSDATRIEDARVILAPCAPPRVR